MILCCGEALIDMIPVVDYDGKAAFSPLSGGAIFNTCIALGRLDTPVALLSGISTDFLGKQLNKELLNSNVSTEFLIRSDRPTTLAFILLKNGNAEYTFYDENSAGRLIEVNDIPIIPENISALYFGGISLCVEPAADTYETLFLRESKKRVTMLDPNIRPGFITNEISYRARLKNMISVSDIVKVSDEDLNWIFNFEDAIDNKVGLLHNLGAKLVIVTKGEDGAIAYVRGVKAIDISVPKVTVIDTVGAGDTFNAGFLSKLNQLECLSKDKIDKLSISQIQKSLEFAVTVAAITVSRKGSNPPFLSETKF